MKKKVTITAVVIICFLLVVAVALSVNRAGGEIGFEATIDSVENGVAYATINKQATGFLAPKLPGNIEFDTSDLDVTLQAGDEISGCYLSGTIKGSSVRVVDVIVKDNSQNDILQVGIHKATAGVYDEEGLKFTWSVENIGDYSVSFDKNMIAQIVLNGEDYAFETEAVTLEPGEAYSVDISIPYPVARQDGTNNVKITATTGDTTATYKESFTH